MNNQDWDTMYPLFLKYFSIICLIILLVVISLEGLYMWFKAKRKPELRQGYRKLILGFSLFQGLPFLILSIGTLIQDIPSIYYFILLGSGNIVSWTFFIALFLEYIFLLYWVWLLGGADFLVMHPSLFINQRPSSLLKVKLSTTAMIGGGFVGLIVLVLINFAL